MTSPNSYGTTHMFVCYFIPLIPSISLLHSSTSLATGPQHDHLNSKEKSKKKEKKVNYFSRNIDILSLAAINLSLPEKNSTSPSNSYFGNPLINVFRQYKSLIYGQVVLMGG